MISEQFQITSENIAIFADVAGDPNPIHQDLQVAQQMGLEGPIAHGMYVYCYLLRQTDQWIAETKEKTSVEWTVKSVRCRFQEPALVGKTFVTSLETGEEKEGTLRLQLVFANEEGKKLTTMVALLKKNN